MKFLVLGSEGQVGASLVDYLKRNNQTVSTFDIVEDAKMDLRIPGAVDEYIKNSDFVFFLAFDVGGSAYLKKYQHTYDFIDNNTKIMCNTFDSIHRYSKPFIFASSQMSNMGFSTYGGLKSIGEHYTKSLNGIIIKFWNVFGIEKDLNKSHVITDFILMAKNNKKIKIKTTGEEIRQFLYSEDCCEALYTIALNYDSLDKNKNYDITSFEWTSIMDIAKIVSNLYPDVTIEVSTSKDSVQNNSQNEPDHNILTLWKPKTNLTSGITKIKEFYEK